MGCDWRRVLDSGIHSLVSSRNVRCACDLVSCGRREVLVHSAFLQWGHYGQIIAFTRHCELVSGGRGLRTCGPITFKCHEPSADRCSTTSCSPTFLGWKRWRNLLARTDQIVNNRP